MKKGNSKLLIKNLRKMEENKQLNIPVVSDGHTYLYGKVYENVKTSLSGRLTISTFYARKVAKMLGGDYDSLTKIQKDILKSDIVFEKINLDNGIGHYTRHH